MSRDKGLEELLNDELRAVPGLTEKAMFGGWAWLLNGNLLCCARDDGMLARLGKGNDGWALQLAGIVPMISRGRRMHGWVRAAPQAYGNDALRRKLVSSALEFAGSLPAK
jgi:TfoX N-terminal domain